MSFFAGQRWDYPTAPSISSNSDDNQGSPSYIQHESADELPVRQTYSAPPKTRQLRASAPRSKRGCVTCKKRHVKCDEAKPSCQRCLKWQGHCGGYSSPAVKTEERSETHTPESSSDDNHQATDFEVSKDLDQDLSQYDRLYFEAWLELSVSLGGNTYMSEVWTQTILQVSYESYAVQQACVAIGAMKLAIGSSPLPHPLLRDSNDITQSVHYQRALIYYGRAIADVRTANESPSDSSIRAAVLCCLLFTCFETLQGRMSGALGHIFHGLTMVDQILELYGGGDLGTAVTSPAPSIIDDETLQMFRLLDEQSWYYLLVNPCPPGTYILQMRSQRMTRPNDPPSQFVDLREARAWWHATQYSCLSYSRASMERVLRGTQQSRDMTGCEDREMQHEYLYRLEQWHASFMPIYLAATAIKGHTGAWLQAISLQVSYLAGYIFIRCPWMCDLSQMDAITPACREIVRLCAVLLENGQERFTMDIGSTWALIITFLRCQDMHVRQEAAKLLKKHPQRDGLWDSRNCLSLGVKCTEVDPSELTNEACGVVRVKGYKQDLRAARWRYEEITLRLLDKEILRDDCWSARSTAEPGKKRRVKGARDRVFIGIELQPMLPTTGRWLLYEAS